MLDSTWAALPPEKLAEILTNLKEVEENWVKCEETMAQSEKALIQMGSEFKERWSLTLTQLRDALAKTRERINEIEEFNAKTNSPHRL